MNRYISKFVFFFSILLNQTTFPVYGNVEDTISSKKAHILFVGLWDRAFEPMQTASELVGIPVNKTKISDYSNPDEVSASLEKIPFASYDLIYVLQINDLEAHALVRLFEEALQKNPKLKIVQLDYRNTQDELLSKGILKTDPHVLDFWNNFDTENLKRLLIYSSVKYLGNLGKILPPVEIASSGFYHPESKKFFLDWDSYQTWYTSRKNYHKDAPWVNIVLEPNYVIYHNSLTYDSLIISLEHKGVNVCAIYGNLENLRNFILSSKPNLLILQHHTGPEGSDRNEKGKTFLEELGIPYLYGAGLLGRMTASDWKKEPRGANWSIYASLPRLEYSGIIEPHIIGAKAESGKGYLLDVPIPERLDRFTDRVLSLINLQTKPNKEKKIVIIYFHHYLSKADVGRAESEMGRYINIPPSILGTLRKLKEQGYRVDSLPPNGDVLQYMMVNKGRNIPAYSKNEIDDYVKTAAPILVPEEQYKKWFYSELSKENQDLVISKQGAPPGNIMVWEKQGKKYIVLPRLQFGNILLAPQPSIGFLDDSLFIKSKGSLPPSHNFLAFYWWLQKEYKADAFLHYGAYGDDVHLPGKELFLSKDDFPDIIMGKVPNIYIWPMETIGIAMLAKRRTYAVIVDHLVAPILPAQFSVDYANLVDAIHYFNESSIPDLKENYRKSITLQINKLKFQDMLGVNLKEGRLITDEEIIQVSNFLNYMSIQSTPQGMHVFGEAPPDSSIVPYIAYIMLYNTDFYEKLKSRGIIDGDFNTAASSEKVLSLLRKLIDGTGTSQDALSEALEKEIKFARLVKKNLLASGESENTGLLKALSGKYVSPGPGGTPLSNPDALPTGRNMYGISTNNIPTKEAFEVGKKLLDQTLQDYRKQHGDYPHRVSFSLTGMAPFSDMGVMEAQIFYLLGMKPQWNEGGKIVGVEAIPHKELGRPRIDPLVSVNGIYLKNFPNLVEFLDVAIQMASSIQEDSNYVRLAKEEIKKQILVNGIDSTQGVEKMAGTRIFGTEAGESSARLVWLIPRSGSWNKQEELGDVWMKSRSYTYGKDQWSQQNELLYLYVLMGREVIISNWGNSLYGPLTNHHYSEETGGLALATELLSKKQPEIVIQDLRNKKNPNAQQLKDVLDAELLSTGFNKEWMQSQMKEGYQGGTQFMQIADNLFQWKSVNTTAISESIWKRMYSIYLNDEFKLSINQWSNTNNPYAHQEMIAVMLEADRKGYWNATQEEKNTMVKIYAESITKYGFNTGPYSGGNQYLDNTVTNQLKKMGELSLLNKYKMEIENNHSPKIEAPNKKVDK